MEAQTCLWDQIETWAKAHPTKPVHEGMVLVLKGGGDTYKDVVVKKVEGKLTETQTCDKHSVCKMNPIAAGVRAQACPGNAPCPASTVAEIHRSARAAAIAAVDEAFNQLLQQITKPPPPRHQRSPSARGQPPVGGFAGGVPAPLFGAPPATYGQAAAVGMGYQPAGYVQPPPGPPGGDEGWFTSS